MKKEDNDLERLKKQYAPLRKKYKLPDFAKLNEDFAIEKIQEKETDFLLREIRLVISDRIAAFLRFFELFLNPAMAPIFILSALKHLGPKNKESIERVYRELVVFELRSISLDVAYNERKEADFVKEITKGWQSIKTEIQEVSELIQKIHSKAKEKKKKSYYG